MKSVSYCLLFETESIDERRKLEMQIKDNKTGYPSIDRPWLKYYSEEAINAKSPECTIYEYLWENNKDHLQDIALRKK